MKVKEGDARQYVQQTPANYAPNVSEENIELVEKRLFAILHMIAQMHLLDPKFQYDFDKMITDLARKFGINYAVYKNRNKGKVAFLDRRLMKIQNELDKFVIDFNIAKFKINKS
jgi:hypothetical protein